MFIAFKQYLIYGFYDGFCEIDGTKYKFDRVFGHVEHVYNRW